MSGAVNGSGPSKPGNDIPARVISAVVLAALALAGALSGGWAAAVVIGIVSVIVHLEWASLTEKRLWPSALFSAALLLALALLTFDQPVAGFVVIGIAIAASALTGNWWRALGLFYAAVLGVGLLVIVLSPTYSLPAILVLLVTVWATDTGAFVAGRAIGGPKLWPAISPNKTWAGAIGGLVAGVLVGTLVAVAMSLPVTAGLVLVIAALAISAQAGDLFESWVKRVFNAKDSSNLIPGHGGLMDRVDGLVFATGLAVLIGWAHGSLSLAASVVLW
jgi:phosphatidate cytidylyltransferase